MDHRPPKKDPNQIRIAVGGNLITNKGSTSTRTADLTTSKLLWNSVLSTTGAKYMCIDNKNFYLTAALDYYEYMKIPLALFPEWIKLQYNLDTHARDGFVFLEIRHTVWGLPQACFFCKQITAKAAQTTWILQMCQHPRPVASHNKTSHVLPCGQRFWSQIRG